MPATTPAVMPDPYPVPPFRSPASGAVPLPGSKSIANRALVLAALAEGTTTLEGMLFSRDTELMLEALARLGVRYDVDRSARTLRIQGCAGRIPAGEADLFVGNAGTAARFLTAMLSLREGGRYRLDGDPAMRERPMHALLEGLSRLGASFEFHQRSGAFPFTIISKGLSGGHVQIDAGASSQFVSALLMAAPMAQAPVVLEAPGVRPAFVGITIEMMRAFGAEVVRRPDGSYHISPASYRPQPLYRIEPDATAASYFMALPLVVGGSVQLPGLDARMLQGDTAFASVVERLGARIQRTHSGWHIDASPPPHPGVTENFATFSDTFLTLAAIAPLLSGPTRIDGIGHTRGQETDRIAAMAAELRKLGCGVNEEASSLEIHPDHQTLARAARTGVEIRTYEDHRIAMSFAILGSADIRGDGVPWLRISNPMCCRKTFPHFFERLAAIHASSHQ